MRYSQREAWGEQGEWRVSWVDAPSRCLQDRQVQVDGDSGSRMSPQVLLPSACVYLAGPGWRVKPGQGQAHQAAEPGTTVCGYMGLDGAPGSAAETQRLSFEEQPDSREFGCAKTLYISDADKRKHFRLVLRLVLPGGRELGTFHSRLIKVISKPSQKKQSLKNTDLCISSGSRVSLFNRLRSQTVSTRYLSVENGAFVASARQWAAFTLHLADEHCSQGDFPPREGYVRYGSLVQLVCTLTGITLPPMIIRKVAKQCALLDVDEPISQLHKCAFQFPGGPPGGGGTYLCLATEKVVQFQASACPKEANKTLLNDSSCWTIIGTESVQFSFNSSLACTREPVTPVPLVSTLEVKPCARGAEGGAGAPARGRRGLRHRLLPPLVPPPPAQRRGRRGHAGAPRRELPRGAQGVVRGRGGGDHVQVRAGAGSLPRAAGCRGRIVGVPAALSPAPHRQEPAVPDVRSAGRGGLRQRLALAAHAHHRAREPGALRRALLPERLLLHLHPGIQREARFAARPRARRGRRRAAREHPPRVHAHQLPPLHPDLGRPASASVREGGTRPAADTHPASRLIRALSPPGRHSLPALFARCSPVALPLGALAPRPVCPPLHGPLRITCVPVAPPPLSLPWALLASNTPCHALRSSPRVSSEKRMRGFAHAGMGHGASRPCLRVRERPVRLRLERGLHLQHLEDCVSPALSWNTVPPAAPGRIWNSEPLLHHRVLPWNTRTCPFLFACCLEPATVPLPVFAPWPTALWLGRFLCYTESNRI
uniref:Recombination signal binding protein for immunoglobulin kappa J region like n=1 Tax=Oryctolagus cuniculus TaxID=9986 RepID=A0A5F9C118_RABIT